MNSARRCLNGHQRIITIEQPVALKNTRSFESRSRFKSDDWLSDFPTLWRVVHHRNSAKYRATWLLALLLCWSLCTYQVWDRVSFYFSCPIHTSVRTNRNHTIRFPMLTACTMETTGESRLRRKYERRMGWEHCRYPRVYELFDYEDVLQLNYTMIMERVNLSHNLFPYCKVDITTNEDYVKDQWCDEILSTSFLGSCISLSSRYSANYSSQNIFSFLGIPPRNSCAPLVLWVLIHEDMLEVPFHSIFPTDFFMTDFLPSVTERIPLAVSEFMYLNTPTNPCTDDDIYTNCIKNYFRSRVGAANLTCTFPFIGPSTLKVCNHWEDLRDARIALQRVFNPHKHPCARKCHKTIYRRGYIKTQIDPSTAYSIGLEYLDNIISVSEEYYAYTLVALLCDIGGNVGLCLGISMITLFEALEACWNYVVACVSKGITPRLNH